MCIRKTCNKSVIPWSAVLFCHFDHTGDWAVITATESAQHLAVAHSNLQRLKSIRKTQQNHITLHAKCNAIRNGKMQITATQLASKSAPGLSCTSAGCQESNQGASPCLQDGHWFLRQSTTCMKQAPAAYKGLCSNIYIYIYVCM